MNTTPRFLLGDKLKCKTKGLTPSSFDYNNPEITKIYINLSLNLNYFTTKTKC